MRWTRGIGLAAVVAGLSGCYYGYRAAYVDARYSVDSRPDASYFCYDCHGYRYFDPYYDWCAYYGFRYRWSAYPGVVHLYRERYVRIREQHPEYGRYRYQPGYRSSTRYRDERDYEVWRARRSSPSERSPGMDDGSRRSAPKAKGRHHDNEPRERKDRKGSDEPSSERKGRET